VDYKIVKARSRSLVIKKITHNSFKNLSRGNYWCKRLYFFV